MRYLSIAIIGLSLLACSSDKKAEPTGVIPEHQLQALDNAKETEELMKKKLEETEKKIQEAVE